jgi:hypothetical protein
MMMAPGIWILEKSKPWLVSVSSNWMTTPSPTWLRLLTPKETWKSVSINSSESWKKSNSSDQFLLLPKSFLIFWLFSIVIFVDFFRSKSPKNMTFIIFKLRIYFEHLIYKKKNVFIKIIHYFTKILNLIL